MLLQSSALVLGGLAAHVLAGLLPEHTHTSLYKRATGKPVFMHYLVGGNTDAHTATDVTDAQKLGVTAFAINLNELKSYSETSVDELFNHAAGTGFKLFFSIDFTNAFSSGPDTFQDYLKQYITRDAYYKYNGKPLVSSFAGESFTADQWNSFRSYMNSGANATSILIVPGFYQATPSTTFFSNANYAALDGVFNWNSWPVEGQAVTVSDSDDATFQTAAKSAGKLFIMGASPLQFKHIDSSQDWYRRGEGNLENRFGEVLSLQPDMLELQTWNDAGESHYMGHNWPEAVAGAGNIPYYADGFDHTGYWQILASFIQAWQRGDTSTANMYPTNGAAAQATFWHHPLLVGADCSADPLAKPASIASAAEDILTGVVLVASGQSGLSATATVGGKSLGSKTLSAGYNVVTFTGLTTGNVSVQVNNGGTKVVSGTGPIPVANSAISSPDHPGEPMCNYNFQVIGLS